MATTKKDDANCQLHTFTPLCLPVDGRELHLYPLRRHDDDDDGGCDDDDVAKKAVVVAAAATTSVNDNGHCKIISQIEKAVRRFSEHRYFVVDVDARIVMMI